MASSKLQKLWISLKQNFGQNKSLGNLTGQIHPIFMVLLMIFDCTTEHTLNEEVEEIFALGDFFESLQLREEEVKRGIEMKEAEVKARDPNARFSKELLEAVRNWKRIPNSVFPLYGVQVLRPLQAKMFGDEVMASKK